MVTTGSSSSSSNKGEETVVDDVVNVSSDEEDDTAEWLSVLLQTKFWRPCKDHWEEHGGEMSLFCLYCYEVACPHCRHDEPGHCLLKVRRYVYRSIILVKDMNKHDLDIDVSRIQTYIVNNQKAVHLRPVRRSPRFRPSGTPRCTTCFVWLRNKPHLFCSLACKENASISLGDFSETEADRKLRQQIQATVEQSPERIVVLALPAQTINPSPVEDQRDTDVPEAGQSYEQIAVDVPKPPSPTLQQTEAPSAPVADAPSAQQPEAPPAPVADQHQLANHPVSFRRRPRKMAHPARAPFF